MINELILKLSIAAKKYAETKPDIYQVAYDKKFAELIVKECCSQVRGIDAMEINKHFGIE